MKAKPKKTYWVTAVVEKDKEGYFAYCPELQGCCTSGSAHEEARANLADAVRLRAEDRLQQPDRPPAGVIHSGFKIVAYPPPWRNRDDVLQFAL